MSDERPTGKKSGGFKRGSDSQEGNAKVHVDSLGRRYVIPSEFIRSHEAQESLKQIRKFRRKQAENA